MPDPITANRTIRTPGAVVTIGGELERVDQIYRLTTHTLLENGYSIPSPTDGPWHDYEDPNPPNVDHLRREVARLERIISQSTDVQALRTLRADLNAAREDARMWTEGFAALDEQVQKAIAVLQTIQPNVEIAIALSLLQ